jgi:hypothetical protein
MARNYNPANWYWIVAGDESRVFSSAVGNFVPANDATFLAWKADGTLPTRIVSEIELGEVLAEVRIRPADAAATIVDAYKDRHAREITLQVVAKWMLWATNEIRTIKGQAPVSAAQFRAFLKGQM